MTNYCFNISLLLLCDNEEFYGYVPFVCGSIAVLSVARVQQPGEGPPSCVL